MKFNWPSFAAGAKGWTAVDEEPDGVLVGVSVRPKSYGAGKPVVVKCGASAAGLTGIPALEDLARQVSVGGFPWTLPLPRSDYQMLVVPEPPVPAAEVDASLRWSLASMVDFPVEDANIASMKIPTAEFLPGREKEVYAIVSRRSVIEERAGPFDTADLNLRAIDVRETALRNIAALLDRKGEGLGLVTVGTTGVTATFTFRGELYLDRFSEQSFDDLLAADAEGRARIFDRIASQVARSVDYIYRTFPFISVSRIAVAPTPQPVGLADYLAAHLEVPVEALDLATLFDFTAVPQLRAPEAQARYLIALGAALRGMRKAA